MWIYIIIAVPLLFVVGTVYTALKEQKRQDKLRRKRAVQTKKARMTEEQIKKNRRIKVCIKVLLLFAVMIGILIYLML